MDKAQITLNRATFEAVNRRWQAFRNYMGKHVTWDEYLEQTSLIMAVYTGYESVKAERLNRFWYKVQCPDCGKENGPLISRRAIVWKVKCDCGKEFIAMA